MSNQIPNIHDSFFKQVLSDPELASVFLREHLPRELTNLLGPGLPQVIPGSFVDEELQQHHSDLLYRVQLNAGASAFAYVLMEHKSTPDQGARLQLLRYVVRLLSQWYDQNERRLPLPPVLPLLVHQGPQGWKLSCEFTDLFGAVPDPLRPYLPSFRHALVDLTRINDQELSERVRLRAFLKALKYSRRQDLRHCLHVALADAPALGGEDLLVILTYLSKGPVTIDSELMHEALQRLVPERKEQIMGGFAQPYYDKGREDGKAEGEARVLLRLLEKRFGAVPDLIQQRISAADMATLETWVERVLDAPDLHSLFPSN